LKNSGDATLQRIDVPAVVDAAAHAYPAWLPYVAGAKCWHFDHSTPKLTPAMPISQVAARRPEVPGFRNPSGGGKTFRAA
jgi:hypothetical protein